MVLVTGVMISAVQAQSSFSLQYSMGFGGNMNSYISSTSMKGATLEYKKFLQDNITIGFDGGWNNFYERRAYDTYTSGVLSLSGIQYRYANAIPLFITTDFHLRQGQKLNPFVGLGVGTIYVDRDLDMGIYTINENAWHFALKPEAGVLVNANPDMDLIFAFRYNYGFATSKVEAQTYLQFNIGFVWK